MVVLGWFLVWVEFGVGVDLGWFLVWVEFGVGVGVEYHQFSQFNNKHPPIT